MCVCIKHTFISPLSISLSISDIYNIYVTYMHNIVDAYIHIHMSLCTHMSIYGSGKGRDWKKEIDGKSKDAELHMLNFFLSTQQLYKSPYLLCVGKEGVSRWVKQGVKSVTQFPITWNNELGEKFLPTVQFLYITTYNFIIYKIGSRGEEYVFFIIMVFSRSISMKLNIHY